jgi:outer membrane lipoprotein carrier protein
LNSAVTRIFLVLIFSGAFWFPAVSQNGNFDCKTGLVLLDKVILDFSNWEGNFRHTVYFESESYTQVETGRLYAEKGGKMRWEYNDPEGKLAVSDGKTVWLYLPDEKRAYKSKIPASKYLPLAARFFFGKLQPSKEFFCVDAKSVNGTLSLELGFKEKNVNFRRLVVGLDEKEKFLARVSYRDELDNQVTFDFFNGRKGAKPDASLFNFTPPQGTRISEDLKGMEF